MQFIEALAIDAYLKKNIEKESQEGTVHSIFKRALNFRTSSDCLITILSKKDFNGPNTVLIPQGFDFSLLNIKAGDRAIFNDSSIYVPGSLFIDFNKALSWRYSPSFGFINPEKVKRNFYALLNLMDSDLNSILCENAGCLYSESAGGLEILIKKLLFPLCSSGELRVLSENFFIFIKAIKDGDKRRIENSVSRIIGLGSGLTPAGDDFLTGFLSVFFQTGSLNSRLKDCTDDITNILLPAINSYRNKTNFISSCLLSFSISGRFSQPVLELLDRLFFSHDIRENSSFNRLKDYGATSGIATLIGIIFGLFLLFDNIKLKNKN